MESKAFLDLGEVEALLGLLENVEELVPWEGRVSQESQDQRAVSGTVDPVGRREMMGEMELAVEDAEAKKEKEDSLGTQDQRVHLASQGQTDHQDPKVSEAEEETQDLREQLDRRETLAIQGHLVTRATEETPLINAPSSKTSKTNALAAMGPWSARSSPRSLPLLWTPLRGSPRTPLAGCEMCS